MSGDEIGRHRHDPASETPWWECEECSQVLAAMTPADVRALCPETRMGLMRVPVAAWFECNGWVDPWSRTPEDYEKIVNSKNPKDRALAEYVAGWLPAFKTAWEGR